MNLQETDYGTMLANETSINPVLLETKALNKLVNEFQFLRAQAVEVLLAHECIGCIFTMYVVAFGSVP
jgi:hypothetical protein